MKRLNPWPLLGLILVATFAALMVELAMQSRAECTTDSECMRLCPASDADCDGGPGEAQ